jgi:hypothetical protein
MRKEYTKHAIILGEDAMVGKGRYILSLQKP